MKISNNRLTGGVVSSTTSEGGGDDSIIPMESSNGGYTVTSSIIMAIKNIRDLKRTIDLEVSFYDRFSVIAQQLDGVSSGLGLAMLKLARLGYGVSRKIKDFEGKNLDFFIDIYRADKRDALSYKRLSAQELLCNSARAIRTTELILATYRQSESPTTRIISEMDEIHTQLKRCYNLLNLSLDAV